MTGKDLLQAMNELEDELLENSLQNASQTNQTELLSMQQDHKSKVGKRVLKWSIAAVAALCCIGGGVAYAAKHNSNLNWKYRYQTTIPKTYYITIDQFSKELQAVKEELYELTYIDTYHDITGTKLGWMQNFDTVEEMVDFIGYDNLKLPFFPGTLENTVISVDGTKEGEISSISAIATYSYANISAHTQASLYIDTDSTSNNNLTKYSSTIVNDTYTTKSGKKVCITLPLKYEFFDEFDGVRGSLHDGDVTYYIHVYNVDTSEQDTEYLIQLIKDWFEQF